MVFKFTIILSVWGVAIAATAKSNDYLHEGGLLPRPVKYFKHSEEQTAFHSKENRSEATASEKTQEPRLGYPISYGSDIQGYSGGISGVYSPLKIDLGGLVLGTVIGLGAVLIVPKLLHIFTPSHGGYSSSGYRRSLGTDDLMSSIKKTISRIDDALTEHNIDSSACLERAVCSYIQASTSSSIIDMFNSTASNPLVNFLVDGSKFKSAILRGQSGENCSGSYPHCPFSKESLTVGLQALISSNNI